jgi:prefoldin subunit 5
MKKLFSLLVLCFSLSGVFAQGYPVFDLSSLLQAIDQFYATYDHINATIEQVQNTYKQLQQQIEAVKKINFDDISWDMSKGGFANLYDIRDPIKSVTSSINRNMNLFNDIYDTVFKKKINFGGKSYTMGGVIAQMGQDAVEIAKGNGQNTVLGNDLADFALKEYHNAAKGYEEGLTYREREVLWHKYGMSGRNYFLASSVGDGITDAISKTYIKTSTEHIDAVNQENADYEAMIGALSEEAGESLVGNMQTLSFGISSVHTSINDLNDLMSTIGNAYAMQLIKEKNEQTIAREHHVQDNYARKQEDRARINGFMEWY